MNLIVIGQFSRNDCVACLVNRRKLLFLIRNAAIFLLNTHHYLNNGILNILHTDALLILTRRKKGRLIEDIFQIRA